MQCGVHGEYFGGTLQIEVHLLVCYTASLHSKRNFNRIFFISTARVSPEILFNFTLMLPFLTI